MAFVTIFIINRFFVLKFESISWELWTDQLRRHCMISIDKNQVVWCKWKFRRPWQYTNILITLTMPGSQIKASERKSDRGDIAKMGLSSSFGWITFLVTLQYQLASKKVQIILRVTQRSMKKTILGVSLTENPQRNHQKMNRPNRYYHKNNNTKIAMCMTINMWCDNKTGTLENWLVHYS